MVLWDGSTYPGVIVPCRPLGLVKIEQDRKGQPGRERNDRVIAAPAIGPRWEDWHDLMDLSPRMRDELAAFFLQVTLFENKHAVVLGFDDAVRAREMIDAAAGKPPRHDR
jgi:inorganic pyrophosphatase